MDVFEDLQLIFNGDDDADLMEIVEELDRQYIVRPRMDHFNYWNEREFIDRFRISKTTSRILINRLTGLSNNTRRNLDRAVSPEDKFLLTLRFLATGDFYITMGDFLGVHKTTAGKIIRQGIIAICSLFHEYVHLPETEEAQQEAKEKFFNIAQFPRVIGAIDCTHIKIQSPSGDNAEVYRNLKSYFSLNCQVVGDADLKIIDLVCRWPGSAHDSHIFENSAVKIRFRNGVMGNAVLLADRGYALEPYILTPIENPQDGAENLFNESQIRTRNVIERLFGVWKRRFPILSVGIRCKLELTQMIIVACAVLHNVAIEQKEEAFEPDEHHEHDEAVIPQDRQEHFSARMEFIDYFQNLLHRN